MEPMLLKCPYTHYAELKILLGEDAIEAWQEGAKEPEYLIETLGGKIIKKIFQTKEETLAYLAGLEDSLNKCLVISSSINA